MKDEPLALRDSLIGVRFVNLSPDSGPVTIGVAGQSDQVVPALAFKAYSEFEVFPAIEQMGAYELEFKDQNGSTLVYTSVDPIPEKLLFKNITLVVIGQIGDSTLEVIRINNF